MSKKKFMQMAGVTSEKEFYKLFPNEEAFFNAYPEARKMAKGGDTGTFNGGVYFPDGGTYDMSYDEMVDYLGMLPQFQMGAMMYAAGGDIPTENMVPTDKIKAKKEKTNLPFFNPYAYYNEVKKNPKDFMSGLQRMGKPIEEPATEQPSFKHGGLHKYQTAGTYTGPYAPPPAEPYDPSDPFGVKKMFRTNNQAGSTSINQSTPGTTSSASQTNRIYQLDPRQTGPRIDLNLNTDPTLSMNTDNSNPFLFGNTTPISGATAAPTNPNQTIVPTNPPANQPANKKKKTSGLFDPSKAAARSAKFQKNLGLVSGVVAGVDEILSRDRMKRWDYNQQQAENIYPVLPQGISGSRGDYVVNTGGFRPDEYVVNKGMYTDQNPGLYLGQMGGVIPAALDLPFDLITAGMVGAPSESESSSGSAGVNPMVNETWSDISSEYEGVKNYGIWGDSKHKKRKSDHNTGDALDIGIKDIDQGNVIAQRLVKEAQDRNIKYIIFNRKIWSPEKGWETYVPNKSNGNNPHTSHVHVSFNRPAQNMQFGGGLIPEALDMPSQLIAAQASAAPMPSSAEPSASPRVGEGSIAVSHNNPGNIHYGNFTKQWGAGKGSPDSDGHVAVFRSLEDGLDAMKKLLFGPGYNSLTISQARNKWVTGKPHNSTKSTKNIVQAMGGDRKLSELTEEEKLKLMSEFVRWEDGNMYKKLKSMKIFQNGGMMSRDTNMQYEEGGVYDMTEDEINQFLAMGGNIEFV
jgi:hypothetical protein